MSRRTIDGHPRHRRESPLRLDLRCDFVVCTPCASVCVTALPGRPGAGGGTGSPPTNFRKESG